MAGRKENIKSLFSNTRTRVIIVFTAVLLIFGIIIGYFKLRSTTEGILSSAEITGAPGIQSIPGSLNPTPEYAKLQENQNISQAIKALETGDSAIPTLVRSQALGEGVTSVGTQNGRGGLGFTTLNRLEKEGMQQSLWIEELQKQSCSKGAIQKVLNEGGQLSDIKEACSCAQLKKQGYALQELITVCECSELRAAGYSAVQLKDAGLSATTLRLCGFSACEQRSAGFSAQNMKDAGFSDGELKGSGFPEEEILKASGLPDSVTVKSVRDAGCDAQALNKLRQSGVSAAAVRRIRGCSAEQLKAGGYNAKDLRDAGFSAADLKSGFTPEQMKVAGYSPRDLLSAGFTPQELLSAGFNDKQLKAPGLIPATMISNGRMADCSQSSLQKMRAAGVSARTIKQTLGCSAKALKDAGYTAQELKDAGFTAAELRNAGFGAKDLKGAGFTPKELQDAGFTPQELKDAGFNLNELKNAEIPADVLKNLGYTSAQLKAAGFTAKHLKDAGFQPNDLKATGFNAAELRKAGFNPKELKNAGFTSADLAVAGFSATDLQNAGFVPETTEVAGLGAPSIKVPNLGLNTGGVAVTPEQKANQEAASNSQQLQAILARQTEVAAEQKYQQKIQQKTSEMINAANQSIQDWKKVATQTYVPGDADKKTGTNDSTLVQTPRGQVLAKEQVEDALAKPNKSVIKTGDILFAVLDTAVNSDEPGPILATIVSGKLKGSKLIGSFTLPANANKMVISFTTLSIPGADRTTTISAFAIDPNTARTALSSRTNHHYMMRYGSLFAASFLQGFGNAIQSANTAVTIGSTGGGNNITVQNGIGQSTLENAVIGLATVGKTWGQQAQQLLNTPTTVQVYSGTGVGVLFTQDVTLF